MNPLCPCCDNECETRSITCLTDDGLCFDCESEGDPESAEEVTP